MLKPYKLKCIFLELSDTIWNCQTPNGTVRH